MACLALKSNGNRCRNYAVVEDNDHVVRGFTCSAHKHYFEKPEKIKRSWLKYGVNANLDAAYLQHKPDQLEHVEEALANGLITVSKRDIQNIVRHRNPTVRGERWAYFLMLVAKYTDDFHPEWNVQLWKDCVAQLWYWHHAIGPVEIMKEDIQRLICVRGGMKWWYEGVHLYPDFQDKTVGFDEEDCFAFFLNCLKFDETWGLEFLSQPEEDAKEHMKGLVSKGRVIDDILLTERLYGWKRGKLAAFKENCRFMIFEYKEELIASGWHPDRFLQWCVDWEDRRELGKTWALQNPFPS